MDDMRIYVACLASYNNGVLHGEWLDLTSDEDELWEGIKRVLRTSPYPNVTVECPECEGTGKVFVGEGMQNEADCPVCRGGGEVPSAEEWAVHDYEGLPAERFGEYPSVEKLCQYAGLFEELNHYGDEGAFRAYLDEVHNSDDLDSAVKDFREAYAGHWLSFLDYTEGFIDETGMLSEVPEDLRYYFDTEKYAEELKDDYTVVEAPPPRYGVYVFRNY